jgi:hypothetical protein
MVGANMGSLNLYLEPYSLTNGNNPEKLQVGAMIRQTRGWELGGR